ncbi:MAG: hypothetical protein ABIP48_32175 [Planctomycetota bacterium]
MARRKRKSGQSVSLFPFLSILACLIGTLTLMITALALGQMDTEEVASGLKLDYLLRQIAALEDRIKELEANADDAHKDLARAKAELERLLLIKKSLLEKNDEEKPKIDAPKIDDEAHKKRLAEIDEEIKAQEELKQELLAKLKELGKPREEADVRIRPGGSGVDLKPTFVECTAADVVLLESDPPKRVRQPDLNTDADFLALLNRIAEDPKSTVIFLVRDDALPTYYAASAVARSRFARNGKLPVIGHGRIDLSLFKK